MADEVKKKEYLVREGKTFGIKQLQAGESVMLTEEEAAGFEDLLEPKDKSKKSGAEEEDTRDSAKNEQNIGVKKK